MPRTARSIEAGTVYHVLNRGNARADLFHKPADFDAFVRILAEGLTRYPVDLFAWCLMSNHWHLICRPRADDALGRLLGWVGVTHVRRHHAHYHTEGGGHLYQGRFKAFPVQADAHFLDVCRYVEANPLRAGMVKRAGDWPYSSFADRMREDGPSLPTAAWPIDRPRDWSATVHRPAAKSDTAAITLSVRRERPYGSAAWVKLTADRLGLIHTTRNRGRPRMPKE